MVDFPKFKSDTELAEWVETHDLSEYMDDLEEVTTPFQVVRTYFPVSSLDIRLPTPYADAIHSYADRHGLTYQAVVRAWLLDRLRQEAPDLVPQ